MVRLTVGSGKVRLQPTARVLSAVIPTYVFNLDDIQEVEVIQGALGSHGLKFRLREPRAATRRICAALLWPRRAEGPIFWIRMRDMPQVITALPQDVIRTSDRRVLLG